MQLRDVFEAFMSTLQGAVMRHFRDWKDPQEQAPHMRSSTKTITVRANDLATDFTMLFWLILMFYILWAVGEKIYRMMNTTVTT